MSLITLCLLLLRLEGRWTTSSGGLFGLLCYWWSLLRRFKFFPYFWSRLLGCSLFTSAFYHLNLNPGWLCIPWSLFLLLLFDFFCSFLRSWNLLRFRRCCISTLFGCSCWLLFRSSNLNNSMRLNNDWCWLWFSSCIAISYHESSYRLWLYCDSRHSILVHRIHEKWVNWRRGGGIFSRLFPVSSRLCNFFDCSYATYVDFRNFNCWKLGRIDTWEVQSIGKLLNIKIFDGKWTTRILREALASSQFVFCGNCSFVIKSVGSVVNSEQNFILSNSI